MKKLFLLFTCLVQLQVLQAQKVGSLKRVSQYNDLQNGSLFLGQFDATTRGATYFTRGGQIKVLAEPTPDATANNALEILAKLTTKDSLDAETSLKLTRTVAQLGTITAQYKMLAISLYRLNEHYYNKITPLGQIVNFDENTKKSLVDCNPCNESEPKNKNEDVKAYNSDTEFLTAYNATIKAFQDVAKQEATAAASLANAEANKAETELNTLKEKNKAAQIKADQAKAEAEKAAADLKIKELEIKKLEIEVKAKCCSKAQ